MICCICDGEIEIQHGWDGGHNPAPVKTGDKDRCCDTCNMTVVIPARLAAIYGPPLRKTDDE